MSDKYFSLTRILNPFDPRQHVRANIDLTNGNLLKDYFPKNVLEYDHVYSVNGKVIKDEEFDTYLLNHDDYVVSCPIIGDGGGGDGGKTIIRLVALIAISIIAPYAAAAIGEIGGIALTTATGGLTTAGSIFVAGVSLAGSAIINALIPPPKPNSGSEGLSDGPSYGIDGAKNTAAEGIVVPVCYGEFRMGGNIINNHVVNEGNNQFLYMLINAGEGPIASISDIELNDQPISSLPLGSYDYQIRLGAVDQPIISWFDNQIEPHNVASTLSTAFTFYTTSKEVDQFRLDFLAPAGLRETWNDDGDQYTNPVTVLVEADYRVAGSGGAWTRLLDPDNPNPSTVIIYEFYPIPVYDEDGNLLSYTTVSPEVQADPLGNGYAYVSNRSPNVLYKIINGENVTTDDWPAAGTSRVEILYPDLIEITDTTTSPVRRSVTSPVLSENFYEVRWRRTNEQSSDERTVDILGITDFNEIINDDIQFNNTALLALKIKLNDKINSIPKVTFINHGKVVKTYNEETHTWIGEPSSNPAWITLDILSDDRYGAGFDISRFDIPKFIELSKHCFDNNLRFNGIFDTSMNTWDATQAVLRCGHAQLVNVGTKFSLAIEKIDNPVMMFSVANMIDGTFKQHWLGTQDRANEIEVSFFDKANKYKQTPIRVVSDSVTSSNAPIKSASVTLFGVDNVDQAYKDAVIILNMNRYILQTVEFGAPIEAIACTVGDLIYVQHDMPQWGYAGRFEAGSTTSVLKLDRPVTMEVGKTYNVLALFDKIQRFSGTILAINGSAGNYYVTLSGYSGENNVKRLIVGTKDLKVFSSFESGVNFGVVVDDITGLSVGNTYQLWDTDAIEEKLVLLSVGSNTTITLVSPFITAPVQYMQWMFGEITKVKKPFRVKSIHGSHEYRRDIVAIEYNQSVYDSSLSVAPTINYSDLDPTVQHVTIGGVVETLIRLNNIIRTRVEIHFTSPQNETYVGSDVYVSKNGAQFELVGNGPSRVSIEADDNDTLTFKVVAKSILGISASYDTAPQITHTVIGKTAPPVNVTGFTWEIEAKQVKLKWDINLESDFSGYEIRKGVLWNSAISVASEITDNSYKIPYLETGSHTYLIKAIDTSGNESLTEASVTISLPGPDAVSLTGQIAGTDVLLTWTEPNSFFLLDHYEIRYGADWASSAATSVSSMTTTYRHLVNFEGNRNYMVAAVDISGSVGGVSSVNLNVTKPSTVLITTEIIDNQILLRWSDAKQTLPIKHYELRKGTTFSSAEILGTALTRFSAMFESSGGIYTYWIVGVDSADNYGIETPITVTLDSPPNFILYANHNSTFSVGGITTGILKTNCLISNGKLYPCRSDTEIFEDHFINNSWTTPQQQIDAGFPYFMQPSTTTAQYVEAINLTALVPSTQISATLTYNTLSGSVTITPKISYKKFIGDAWTDAPGVDTVFATDFQYIKVTYDFTSTGGDDIIEITGLNIRLNTKIKDDAGTIVCNAGDSGGTTVPFNVDFVVVSSVTGTAQSTTPDVVVIDLDSSFTFCKILVFDLSGTRITRTVRWQARGS